MKMSSIAVTRTHQKRLEKKACFLILMCIAGGYAQENTTDFDWSGYQRWENKTIYTKTYVVDQKHANASDNNDGSSEKPLKTINRAAELAKAGERVLVYGGVYRETIFPARGGESNSKMISYEAAPGEDVVVRGSKILNANWEQRKIYTDVLKDTSLTYTWSRKIWVTTIPDSFFEDGYFPLKLPNILPEEHKLMPLG